MASVACCHPTDHIAGNVDRDSIRTIWNSRAMQNLRRAHFEAIGTLFCTGCIHAPYLSERSMSRVVDGVKTARPCVRIEVEFTGLVPTSAVPTVVFMGHLVDKKVEFAPPPGWVGTSSSYHRVAGLVPTFRPSLPSPNAL